MPEARDAVTRLAVDLEAAPDDCEGGLEFAALAEHVGSSKP